MEKNIFYEVIANTIIYSSHDLFKLDAGQYKNSCTKMDVAVWSGAGQFYLNHRTDI